MNYLCLDVGGSSIKWAVANEQFDFLKKGKLSNTFSDREAFLAAIETLLRECGEEVSAAALSYCGELDPEAGLILNGGAYRYNSNFAIRDELEKRLGVPVSVEKDSNCAALAELARGNLQGRRNAAVITLGTGIGCALVLDGQVYSGSHHYAGYQSVLLKDIERGLSPENTAVKLISANYLTEAYKKAAPESGGSVDGIYFFRKAADGDPAASSILRTYCRNLAHYIFNLQLTLDLEAFLLGGGISAEPVLVQLVREELDALYGLSPLRELELEKPVIDVCRFRNDAGLIGALCHHFSSCPGTA